MKFSLFVHMEKTDSSQSYAQLYNEFLSLCKIAEDGGMHAIWTGEHHCMDFTIAPNPFLTISDLANKLKHVRLGTGTIIAPFWHPIKLAGESAMTDLITSGRLELGIARGAYSFEYERLMPGMDAWEAGQRLREMIPAIRELWKGDYSHEGEFYSFPKSTSTPKPLQQNGPPIWVAARDPNSHEFAINNSCNVQVTPLWQDYNEVQDLILKFNSAKKKYNPQSQSKIMLLQHTYVSDEKNELDEAAKKFSEFYAHFGAWFQNQRPVNQASIKKLSSKELSLLDMYAPEKMKKNLLFGTIDEVTSRLKDYEKLGYDEFSYWIDSGMSYDEKVSSLNNFIQRVMPAFKS